MYGKAVKCDMCDRIEIIDSWENTTFFDAGFRGWVRITVNEPRDYGWPSRTAKHATEVNSVDCCSIACANDYLYKVRETVPVEAQA